ncbi:uncharacterized protein LY79DRAFT_128419 [Colletotrichum navitas]|uniref:Uncharacterized protein n=1 Tax=Colletotrichum navitas TaxID=681940 RepID=A0AAD8V7M7_9PEZI|nr:uncharacterized protein LY79DRAFT_128419 [Colletotrichum navitas]KAK1594861.1 hypothetical protein LY79DRAFT_128419 [Colletotrichum navitas]
MARLVIAGLGQTRLQSSCSSHSLHTLTIKDTKSCYGPDGGGPGRASCAFTHPSTRRAGDLKCVLCTEYGVRSWLIQSTAPHGRVAACQLGQSVLGRIEAQLGQSRRHPNSRAFSVPVGHDSLHLQCKGRVAPLVRNPLPLHRLILSFLSWRLPDHLAPGMRVWLNG